MSYRELKTWQLAMDLAQQIYSVTNSFPKSELYGMTSQMRRASVSIPSNFAEGYARNHRAEYLQFIGIARGSLAELETLVILSESIGYLDSAESHLLKCEMVAPTSQNYRSP
ncbi:MAG: four helix bundle protein [Rhabdochlamydiaceae bacterium]